ncbi:FG-GAP repeat domain-containing protein [Myxococcus eversor]|uniref:FG-GAP repeat domain-containing protein n=1 Tax=Myxococcus eversor TaxID=2709661 RepID=UPI003B839649
MGDFNGDGRTDFLSANGNFDIWLANPDGTVRHVYSVPPPPWCSSAASCVSQAQNGVVVGDFNGDGRTDFLSANGNFDIWLANPDGTVRHAYSVPPPPWCSSAASCVSQAQNGVVVGDFNGDGRTDFLSANQYFDTFLANPDGTIGYVYGVPPPVWCGSAASCLSQSLNRVVVGDFDGDARTDFLSANQHFDTFLANPGGDSRYVYGVPPPVWCSSASGCLNSAQNGVVSGDFNGDGRTDFLSANQHFDIFLANPGGDSRYVYGVPPPNWCGSAASCLSQARNGVVVGDFNGDGRTDFLSANSYFDTWMADADGSFPSVFQAHPPSWCSSASSCLSQARNGVVVGDFNGDGRTDFLSANGYFDAWLSR